MEISRARIEEVFKNTICFYSSYGRSKSYIIGTKGCISLTEAVDCHIIGSSSLQIQKLDIDTLSLEQKYRVYELIEAYKAGELTIL